MLIVIFVLDKFSFYAVHIRVGDIGNFDAFHGVISFTVVIPEQTLFFVLPASVVLYIRHPTSVPGDTSSSRLSACWSSYHELS